MRHSLAAAALVIGITISGVAIGQSQSPSAELQAAIATSSRTPANVARDRYRHPAETLAFFGVKPADTVVEISPGGGWYTEILGPYLKARGTLYLAVSSPTGHNGVRPLMAKHADAYGKVNLVGLSVAGMEGVPDGSADVVLTFRNVHNWIGSGRQGAEAMFASMFRMLKPGGTLGVVEHRLPEARDVATEEKSGYMKVSSVVAFAKTAGFELVGQSEVNANPKDTADWPNGVWTLPPTYALKDVDREKYAAIGESDRMTLKFRKPG